MPRNSSDSSSLIKTKVKKTVTPKLVKKSKVIVSAKKTVKSPVKKLVKSLSNKKNLSSSAAKAKNITSIKLKKEKDTAKKVKKKEPTVEKTKVLKSKVKNDAKSAVKKQTKIVKQQKKTLSEKSDSKRINSNQIVKRGTKRKLDETRTSNSNEKDKVIIKEKNMNKKLKASEQSDKKELNFSKSSSSKKVNNEQNKKVSKRVSRTLQKKDIAKNEDQQCSSELLKPNVQKESNNEKTGTRKTRLAREKDKASEEILAELATIKASTNTKSTENQDEENLESEDLLNKSHSEKSIVTRKTRQTQKHNEESINIVKKEAKLNETKTVEKKSAAKIPVVKESEKMFEVKQVEPVIQKNRYVKSKLKKLKDSENEDSTDSTSLTVENTTASILAVAAKEAVIKESEKICTEGNQVDPTEKNKLLENKLKITNDSKGEEGTDSTSLSEENIISNIETSVAKITVIKDSVKNSAEEKQVESSTKKIRFLRSNLKKLREFNNEDSTDSVSASEEESRTIQEVTKLSEAKLAEKNIVAKVSVIKESEEKRCEPSIPKIRPLRSTLKILEGSDTEDNTDSVSVSKENMTTLPELTGEEVVAKVSVIKESSISTVIPLKQSQLNLEESQNEDIVSGNDNLPKLEIKKTSKTKQILRSNSKTDKSRNVLMLYKLDIDNEAIEAESVKQTSKVSLNPIFNKTADINKPVLLKTNETNHSYNVENSVSSVKIIQTQFKNSNFDKISAKELSSDNHQKVINEICSDQADSHILEKPEPSYTVEVEADKNETPDVGDDKQEKERHMVEISDIKSPVTNKISDNCSNPEKNCTMSSGYRTDTSGMDISETLDNSEVKTEIKDISEINVFDRFSHQIQSSAKEIISAKSSSLETLDKTKSSEYMNVSQEDTPKISDAIKGETADIKKVEEQLITHEKSIIEKSPLAKSSNAEMISVTDTMSLEFISDADKVPTSKLSNDTESNLTFEISNDMQNEITMPVSDVKNNSSLDNITSDHIGDIVTNNDVETLGGVQHDTNVSLIDEDNSCLEDQNVSSEKIDSMTLADVQPEMSISLNDEHSISKEKNLEVKISSQCKQDEIPLEINSEGNLSQNTNTQILTFESKDISLENDLKATKQTNLQKNDDDYCIKKYEECVDNPKKDSESRSLLSECVESSEIKNVERHSTVIILPQGEKPSRNDERKDSAVEKECTIQEPMQNSSSLSLYPETNPSESLQISNYCKDEISKNVSLQSTVSRERTKFCSENSEDYVTISSRISDPNKPIVESLAEATSVSNPETTVMPENKIFQTEVKSTLCNIGESLSSENLSEESSNDPAVESLPEIHSIIEPSDHSTSNPHLEKTKNKQHDAGNAENIEHSLTVSEALVDNVKSNVCTVDSNNVENVNKESISEDSYKVLIENSEKNEIDSEKTHFSVASNVMDGNKNEFSSNSKHLQEIQKNSPSIEEDVNASKNTAKIHDFFEKKSIIKEIDVQVIPASKMAENISNSESIINQESEGKVSSDVDFAEEPVTVASFEVENKNLLEDNNSNISSREEIQNISSSSKNLIHKEDKFEIEYINESKVNTSDIVALNSEPPVEHDTQSDESASTALYETKNKISKQATNIDSEKEIEKQTSFDCQSLESTSCSSKIEFPQFENSRLDESIINDGENSNTIEEKENNHFNQSSSQISEELFSNKSEKECLSELDDKTEKKIAPENLDNNEKNTETNSGSKSEVIKCNESIKTAFQLNLNSDETYDNSVTNVHIKSKEKLNESESISVQNQISDISSKIDKKDCLSDSVSLDEKNQFGNISPLSSSSKNKSSDIVEFGKKISISDANSQSCVINTTHQSSVDLRENTVISISNENSTLFNKDNKKPNEYNKLDKTPQTCENPKIISKAIETPTEMSSKSSLFPKSQISNEIVIKKVSVETETFTDNSINDDNTKILDEVSGEFVDNSLSKTACSTTENSLQVLDRNELNYQQTSSAKREYDSSEDNCSVIKTKRIKLASKTDAAKSDEPAIPFKTEPSQLVTNDPSVKTTNKISKSIIINQSDQNNCEKVTSAGSLGNTEDTVVNNKCEQNLSSSDIVLSKDTVNTNESTSNSLVIQPKADETLKVSLISTPDCSKPGSSKNSPSNGKRRNAECEDSKELKKAKINNPPVREYLDQFVPFLLEGLLKIAYNRPEDPIQYLADWMIFNKDEAYKRIRVAR